MMTKHLGSKIAHFYGLSHEIYDEFIDSLEIDTNDHDQLMDFLNNLIGIQIGKSNYGLSDEELADVIYSEIAAGHMYQLDESNPYTTRPQMPIVQSHIESFDQDNVYFRESKL